MNKSKKTTIKAVVGIALLIGAVLFLLYPSTTRADPPTPPSTIRTFDGDVNVTLTAIDEESGVNWTKIEIWYISVEDYEADPSAWSEYLPEELYSGEKITLSMQGYYQLHYYSEDNIGNTEATKRDTILIWQDRTPPTTTVHYEGNEIILQ